MGTEAVKRALPRRSSGQHGRVGVITSREIEAASSRAKSEGKDVWLTDPAARGQGRFTIRCTPSGARVCMYRYTLSGGARDILKIADYDPRGGSGMTLHEAREKAGEFARLSAGGKDLRFLLVEKAQALASAEQAVAASRSRAERGSLQALFKAYLTTLDGRESHYDAQSIFKLHVTGPFPELVKRPAAQVTAEQLRDVLARLIDAGKGRTAAKLRAYLRAAYSMAMRAGLDPTLPEALTAFDVHMNPADRLPSLSQFSKALDRTLTLVELRFFWQRLIRAADGPARDALMTCLYLGGQRPTQLLRVTAQNVDIASRRITLHDPKGRNRHVHPRRHVLPIPDDVMPLLKRRIEQAGTHNSPLFSTQGRVPLRIETLATLVEEIEAAMLAEGELDRGAFSMRDLRRTAETHMAAIGISSDVRAQVQSHGLGGIQTRHYDRHDYMAEKQCALELWRARFAGEN